MSHVNSHISKHMSQMSHVDTLLSGFCRLSLNVCTQLSVSWHCLLRSLISLSPFSTVSLEITHFPVSIQQCPTWHWLLRSLISLSPLSTVHWSVSWVKMSHVQVVARLPQDWSVTYDTYHQTQCHTSTLALHHNSTVAFLCTDTALTLSDPISHPVWAIQKEGSVQVSL